MGDKMSEETAWNQGELSEETRNMVLDSTALANHTMAMFSLLEEIARPNHAPKKYRDDHLTRGLRTMMIDFQLSGQDDYAETAMLAIEALGGQVKPD
jgi:hypothetical protein